MKLIYCLIWILVLQPAFSNAQRDDIASLHVYRKLNDNWNLWSKTEFIRTNSAQSNIGYRWENDHWRKTYIQTREVSTNQDTILTYSINYYPDTTRRVQVGKCYKVRNEIGQQIGVMFELEGKTYPSQISNGFTPLESLPGGSKLSYPYQNVFEEAEKLLAIGEAIENIKPTYTFCKETYRPDEVFTLSINEQGELISFESDSTKVLVISKNKQTEPQSGPGSYHIYPNPFHDDIFISINEVNIEKLSIINYLGEIVYSIDIHEDRPTLHINLNHVPAGVYYVNSFSDNLTYTTKVLKLD